MFAWKRISFLLTFLLFMIISVACQSDQQGDFTEASGTVVEDQDSGDSPSLGLPNPAAVYCEGLGFTLQSVTRDGGEDADCIFSDGTRCGQWDFLSGRCGQEHSFCMVNAGTQLKVDDNVATCIFEDGSTCNEYQYYLGECQVGTNPAAMGEPESDYSPLDETGAGELVSVVGWMGYILSMPVGAQFDDYVVLLPEGEVGEFGIEGATEHLRAQIIALRDKEQPGKYAHFWGTLTCDVIDYRGCQLLVERLHVDGSAELFEPDLVEGWVGTVSSLSYDEPGASHPDDFFQLAGKYPLQYGIDSAISATTGERDLSDAINSLQDTGEEVRIWGQLICGVPDAGGCRIEVYRIETSSQVYEITPQR